MGEAGNIHLDNEITAGFWWHEVVILALKMLRQNWYTFKAIIDLSSKTTLARCETLSLKKKSPGGCRAGSAVKRTAVLSEDPELVPSTHMAAHNCL